jgi:hypothetical protein
MSSQVMNIVNISNDLSMFAAAAASLNKANCPLLRRDAAPLYTQ